VADSITLLLALEARDQATRIIEGLAGTVKGFETAIKSAAAQASRSSIEIEAANTKAAASAASYDRAVASQVEAQSALRDAMLASKAAQLEADAAVREGSVSVRASAAQVAAAADAEEAALMRLQESEKLVATRSKEMAAAQKAASTETGLGTQVLKGATVAAAATVIAVGAIAVSSVHAAGTFEASTTRLITSANETRANIDLVRQGMLTMAGDVGYSTEALSTAMYKVESGGQHGAAGLQVLRAAAEGAKTENANLTTVADAVTTALVDYHGKASDAAEVTSKMVAATASGKMTFEDLAASLHSVLPNASAAHVSLNDILGDLAAMTVHGMSAQQAAQNLADTIKHMQTPTAVQAKELAILGMTTNQLAADLKTKGLSGTLQEISQRIQHLSPPGSDKVILDLRTALNGLSPAVRELGMHLFDGTLTAKEYAKAAGALEPIAAKQAMSFGTLAGSMHRIGDQQTTGATVMQNYGTALYKATGDATSLNTALMLAGDNAGVANDAISKVSKATVEAGGHVKGWSEIQGTFNYKMDALKGKLEAAKIAIGTGLLPVVSAVATEVMRVVGPIAEWTVHHQQLSAIVLGSIGGFAALVLVIIGAMKAFEMVKTAIMGVRTAMVFLKLATLEADAAFAMTPLGLIVVALVAVGVAVYYCWTHFATFRKIVIETWDGIKTAALAVWNNVLKPAFDGIKIAIMQGVVPAVMWLWRNAIEPAFRGIAAVGGWLWNNVLKPYFAAWSALFSQVLGPVIMWLWRNVVVPAWQGIRVAIGEAWTVIKPIWDVIQASLKVLGAIFYWLYKDVIQPAWQAIQIVISIAWAVIQVIFGLIQIELKILAVIFTALYEYAVKPAWQLIAAIIGWAWHTIIKPLWEVIKFELRFLGDTFQWLYNNVIKPVWQGISSVISAEWHNVIKPIFNFLAGILKDYVLPAFKSGVDAVGKAWHGLIDLAKIPVKFVINTVLNDGLLAGYNLLAHTFGVKPDNVHIPLPAGFATGGPVWGEGSSTSDSILAMLSHGEHVLTAAEVKRAGGHDAILAWRRSLGGASMPHYPGDGSGGIPGFAGGGIVDTIAGIGQGIFDLFTDPVKVLLGPINAIINSIPGAGNLRDVLVGGAHKLGDGLLSWAEGSGSKGGAGAAMAFLKGQVGKPYIWASAGPEGYDCSGIVSAVFNVLHGQNPYVHTFSTANEAPFFPLAGPGGLLTAGWTNPGEPGPGGTNVGHTAAVLAGIPFESTGPGVSMGAGVTPVGLFAHVGHFDRGGPVYPGWNAVFNGTGGMEYVADPRGGGGGQSVVIDLRGSQFMTDRDIDVLLDKLDKRLVRTLLPGAGVQVRR
jgi:hypothetical protein